jgi:hypothetical protein
MSSKCRIFAVHDKLDLIRQAETIKRFHSLLKQGLACVQMRLPHPVPTTAPRSGVVVQPSELLEVIWPPV